MSAERIVEESKKFSQDIFADLENYSDEFRRLQWEGTFGAYIEKVIENPNLTRSSHRILYDMILAKGVEVLADGNKKYKFFESGPNALFGIEEYLSTFVDILKAGAEGLEPKKRNKLFMGPPGSGKSTIVTALKRGLEEYCKTNEGAIYAISSCPMHEDPLHLIPYELRTKFEERYGVRIEGDLCPDCNQQYGQNSAGIKEVKVKRIFFSEKDRVGIGTFQPSDPKSQDMTELVGSVDLSKIGEYGSASDARAYRFDGELNVANRGLIEFVEMLKADERFLYILLSLAQEQVIKTGRFANIYADEVILAHTNESEYLKFAKKPEMEALQDRTLVIEIPYNLKVSAEILIYDKLIGQSDLITRTGMHLAPHTLRVSSIFAALTRFGPSKKSEVDGLKKMKIYDNEEVTGISAKDIKELREECPREGMDGISPRYVIDSLSTALIQEGRKCLTPPDALRALRDNLDNHPHTRDMDKTKKDEIRQLVATARSEYDDLAKKEVQSAFVYSFREQAKTLFDNYVDHIEASCNKTKIKDPITDEEVDPDEKLMRGIEEQIGVGESGKMEFRQEVLRRIGQLARKGERFDYASHPRLKEAIEKKLFSDLKDIVKITTSAKNPNPEQLEKVNEVVDRLVKENGYCYTCANDLLRYVGRLLSRSG